MTHLVGNPFEDVLFGLIVMFETKLLESNDENLQFLYNNGHIYNNDIDELPLDLIEGILLSTLKLKSKFQHDDFMTLFLI